DFPSRHTGALLPGCSAWRCRCCWESDCANAAPAESKASSARSKTLMFGTLLGDAYVFVLAELPGLDLVLPARAVALGPLAAVGERRVVPGRRSEERRVGKEWRTRREASKRTEQR